MRSDTKAALPALIILAAVAVEILGLGIAAVGKVAGARSAGGRAGVEASLESGVTEDRTLGYRMRRPEGVGLTFTVTKTDRGGLDLESLVKRQSAELAQSGHSVSSKRVRVNGHPACLIEFDQDIVHPPQEEYFIIGERCVIDDGGNGAFVVEGQARVSGGLLIPDYWVPLTDAMQSCLATFEVIAGPGSPVPSPPVSPAPTSPPARTSVAPPPAGPNRSRPPVRLAPVFRPGEIPWKVAPIPDDQREAALQDAIRGLGNWKSEGGFPALATLSRIPPDDTHRAQVVSALTPLLDRAQFCTQIQGLLTDWADDATRKALIESLGSTKSAIARSTILAVAAADKTSKTAMALAEQAVKRPDPLIQAALRRMGSVAEPGARRLLEAPDSPTVIAGIRMLMDFGTSESLPALEELAKSTNPAYRAWAKPAIDAIIARKK